MDEYRLYFVGQRGERTGAFDFTSTDDQCARAAARQFGCERGAELWCRGRSVGEWRRDSATARSAPGAHNDATLRDAGAGMIGFARPSAKAPERESPPGQARRLAAPGDARDRASASGQIRQESSFSHQRAAASGDRR